MTVHIVTSSQPIPSTHGEFEDALVMGWGDTLILGTGAEIAAYGEGSSAIVSDLDSTLIVHGRVHSEQSSAIVMYGVINIGEWANITGGFDGVYMYGANAPGSPHILTNAGKVSGVVHGLRLDANENIIANSGQIVGGIGIQALSSDKMLVIANTGLIKGTKEGAIYGAVYGSTVVTNKGQIEGDVILGYEDDLYDGRGGTVTGRVYLSTGIDVAHGGDGSDTFETWWGTKFIDAGAGIDTLEYRQAATVDLRITKQQQTSALSQDTILNIENLNGSEFADHFIGNIFANTLAGNAGNDTLKGYDGNDLLSGGSGNDALFGGTGSDTAAFTGKFSDYTITVEDAGIIIADNRGSGDGTDYLIEVEFALFSDRIFTLPAAAPPKSPPEPSPVVPPTTPTTPMTPLVPPVPVQNLKLVGSKRADVLMGGKGHDLLNGGLGKDKLTGDAGQDIFVFGTKLRKDNIDRITDFSSAEDTIQLSKAVFGKIAKGLLKQSAFYKGVKAQDKNDRIGINEKTGDLSYDADGSGRKYKAIAFAKLDVGTAVAANDFWIA